MLDSALSTGALSLDQVSAAAEFATPETDATLAAESAGRTPSQVAVAARTLNPPQRADDQALYARRSLAMTWTHGGRELAISGRLPLEQGSAFEHAIWEAAKAQRAREKRDDVARDWSHSAADALVALTTQSRVGGTRGETTTAPRPARSRATLIIHVAADGPPLLEGAGPISPETAEYLSCDARRIEITARARPRSLAGDPLRELRPTSRAAQAIAALSVPRVHRDARARSPSPRRIRARRANGAREPDPAVPAASQTPSRPPPMRRRFCGGAAFYRGIRPCDPRESRERAARDPPDRVAQPRMSSANRNARSSDWRAFRRGSQSVS